jgi:hypothetical protein
MRQRRSDSGFERLGRGIAEIREPSCDGALLGGDAEGEEAVVDVLDERGE